MVTPLMVVVLGVVAIGGVLGDVVGTTGNSMAIALSVGGAVVVETYWLPLVRLTLLPSAKVTVSTVPTVPFVPTVVLAAVSTLLTLTFNVGKMVWLRVWVKVTADTGGQVLQ